MKPIPFSVSHDGITRNGVAVRKDASPYEPNFHVTFEDGYKNDFFIPIDADKWCEEGLGFTTLAKRVGAEIEFRETVARSN